MIPQNLLPSRPGAVEHELVFVFECPQCFASTSVPFAHIAAMDGTLRCTHCRMLLVLEGEDARLIADGLAAQRRGQHLRWSEEHVAEQATQEQVEKARPSWMSLLDQARRK